MFLLLSVQACICCALTGYHDNHRGELKHGLSKQPINLICCGLGGWKSSRAVWLVPVCSHDSPFAGLTMALQQHALNVFPYASVHNYPQSMKRFMNRGLVSAASYIPAHIFVSFFWSYVMMMMQASLSVSKPLILFCVSHCQNCSAYNCVEK